MRLGISLRILTVLTAHAVRWFMLQAEIRWMRRRSKERSEAVGNGSGKVLKFDSIRFLFAALMFFTRDAFLRICRILPLLMLLILPHSYAFADGQPGMRDFTRAMPLTLSGSGALYELSLPAEVYLWSRQPDLRDLAVFNGRGEVVPFALLEQVEKRLPPAGRQLPLFRLGVTTSSRRGDISLRIKTDEHGAIVNLNTARGAVPGGVVADYIVDASALDQQVNGLDFALSPHSQGYLGTLRVECSDDLREWRPHASGAIATLSTGERRLHNARIAFSAVKARYFRLGISPEQGAPRIEAVTAGLEPTPALHQREKRNLIITPVKGKSGEYLASSGGRLPVDRLRLVFTDDNSMASAIFLSRPDVKSPWIERGRGECYRLRRNGGVVENAPLEIPATPDEQWLIRVRQPGSGLGSRLPCLEIGWRPHRLVFSARGEPPFQLAYGSARAPLSPLRDDTLSAELAEWERRGIRPLPAEAGVSRESGGERALRSGIPAATWRHVALWGGAAARGVAAGADGLATGAGDESMEMKQYAESAPLYF